MSPARHHALSTALSTLADADPSASQVDAAEHALASARRALQIWGVVPNLDELSDRVLAAMMDHAEVLYQHERATSATRLFNRLAFPESYDPRETRMGASRQEVRKVHHALRMEVDARITRYTEGLRLLSPVPKKSKRKKAA
jgi:hypothetical protein